MSIQPCAMGVNTHCVGQACMSSTEVYECLFDRHVMLACYCYIVRITTFATKINANFRELILVSYCPVAEVNFNIRF